MSEITLLDAVAELTGQRDRDALEGALATLLMRQLEASAVNYHRLVPCEGGPRLWQVVRATAEGVRRLGMALDDSRMPPLEGFKARCISERSVMRLSNRGNPRCNYLFPVLSEREPVGVIEAEGVHALLPPHREIGVETILRIYRNHLALLDYSEHDTLTSLRNRRTFDADFARMQRELPEPLPDDVALVDPRQTPPPDAPHWLAVVDVDRFKRINDEFGHLYGDEVLLLLAQMMRAQFRPIDRLYRFGGEEFVVVLSRIPQEFAPAPLERLRVSVASREFSRVGRVTISIGYTRIGQFDDAAGAFGRADAALYHAKQNGRNQTHAWEELVAAGHLEAPKANDAVVELF